MSATDLLVWGVFAHLVADWILQNDWIAVNKDNLKHSAAWLHGFIHFMSQVPVFGGMWQWHLGTLVALILALVHMGIDTRKPRDWWMDLLGQTSDGIVGVIVCLAVDQVMHIMCIAIAALMVASM